MHRALTGSGPDSRTSGPAAEAPAWHALAAEEVRERLETPAQGLSSAEAERRLAKYGPNRLPEPPRRGPLRRLLAQFDNVLIYVLLAAGVITLGLGHWVDAGVILGVVIVNAGIGFIQEGRAEQALAAIRGMVAPRCTVKRDGRRQTVDAATVVPGDLVILDPGDQVPADLRLLRARTLRIDEAILTGESVPVEKSSEPLSPDTSLAERTNMAYSGTLAVAGHGQGIVVATGGATELGRISHMLGGVEPVATPLLQQMDQFGRQLTAAILALSAAVFAFAVLVRGYPIADAFMAVVGLAVAAIPEGLPAVMTITLAIGVRRMAARKAIIRRLPAVETLGSVSIICTDKTGTLTRNEMTVRSAVIADERIEASGIGYAPEGRLQRGGAPIGVADDPVLDALARAALLCNDADLRQREGRWIVDGDPMEGALIAFAIKAGLDPAAERREFRRRDEIPFDASHRLMATLHDAGPGAIVFVKGAPEAVIGRCRARLGRSGAEPLDRAAAMAAVDELARQGERVLALAVDLEPASTDMLDLDMLDERLVLIGLVGLIDPPREEAVAAIAECRSAGIRVKMITGDHAATAKAIAEQLALADGVKVATGAELDRLDAEGFRRAAREAAVFARTTPGHKLRIVEALQADEAIVAMTGDGVNDSPALKRADVGIAMGIKGTEAAKQAAEMVLADDNFASIVAAVHEGRTVYDNLKKVIGWTLPTNGGQSVAIIGAILAGMILPVTPVQILWVNMITSVTLGLTLAFEPPEPNVMRRPPRPRHVRFLSGLLLWRILFVSLLFAAGVFGMFLHALARGLPLEEARTIAVNVLVVMQIFYLFSVRYIDIGSLSWTGILGTPAVLVGIGLVTAAQFAFTYAPFMQFLFESRPVSVIDGLGIVGVGIVLFVVVELEKLLLRRLGWTERH